MRRRQKSIFPVLAGIAACILLIWIIIPKRSNPYPRETMVLIGNPMTVLSWNESDRSVILLYIPEDMTAEGTHGYGTYSFESFWKLGAIDKKDGTVLSESVSEALGIPVNGYIGAKNGVLSPDVFTFRHIFTYLRGGYRTNIPFTTFLRFVWLFEVTKPDRTVTYDFTHNPSLIADEVSLGDGSHQLLLIPARVDARLAHLFEDDRVRRQTVTVAVYNTTELPSLGTRVARLLGNLGVSVVSVGNDTPEVNSCSVSGTKSSLTSISAQVIESVLGCVRIPTTQSDRADLIIRIGASYAKRFLPN